ncbi:PGF-CTERM sorting domain-containing protein [Natrialbaceae archaeon GCM10025896]
MNENELSLALTAEDPVEGLNVQDGVATPEFEIEGSDGSSDDDNYVVAESGVTGISADDATENRDTEVGEITADIEGDEGGFANYVGSQITAQTAEPGDVVRVYEAVGDSDDNYTLGDQTGAGSGTAPGDATTIDTSELGAGEYFVTFGGDNSQQVFLELETLDLQANATENEITEEDDLQIEVDSDDFGDLRSEDSGVQVWVSEAGDDQVSDVIYADERELTGQGSTTFTVDPADDLNGAGDYEAVVLHKDSGVVAETGEISVSEPLRESVDIVSPQFGDQYARGDIAEFELELSNTREATITLGDRAGEQNFETNITVRDSDEDGTASFKVNTYQLGDGPVAGNQSAEIYQDITAENWSSEDREYPHGVFSTDDGTSVVSAEAHPSIRVGGGSNDNASIQVVIADGGYDLVASPGDTPASEEESRATDRSQLRLQPRETGEVATWSAPAPDDPAGVEDIETVDEIATAINESVVTPQDGTLADEDYLIVQAQATGLEGVLATAVEENEDLSNTDVEEFLDRSEDHEITEVFTASELVDIRTTQNLTQVAEIVEGALEDQERNVPEDSTFALPAQLDLLADSDNQKVLAGTNDLGSLDEYFIMTPVSNETVADLIEPEGDDVAQDVDAYTDEEIEAVIDIHPNYDAEDFDDGGDFDAAAARDFFEENAEFEIPTNEPPTQFETTFELAPNVSDDQAENFPLNDFFGGDSEETLIQWSLVKDEVSLDNIETILEDEEQVDRLLLPPQDNYTITGETEIAAGTTLEHDTQSSVGETPPFFDSGEFVVEYTQGGPNNISFVVNESLSERAGQDFTMQIRRANGFLQVTPDGETIEGQITEPAEVVEHVFEDQEGSGEVVNVASVNVSTAGAVQIQNADGDVLGETLIEEGLNEDVRVLLDTPVEESQELTSVIVTSAGEEFDEGPTNQTAQYTVAGSQGEASFDVSNLNPIATEVEPGQEITVTADITNNGDTNATKTVELRLDGDTLTSEDVTLEPDATQEVSFTVNAPDEEADYVHSVWTEDDEAEGQLTVATADDDGGADDNATDDGDDEDADDGGAGFGVAAALIALLGAALLAYRRRAE